MHHAWGPGSDLNRVITGTWRHADAAKATVANNDAGRDLPPQLNARPYRRRCSEGLACMMRLRVTAACTFICWSGPWTVVDYWTSPLQTVREWRLWTLAVPPGLLLFTRA